MNTPKDIAEDSIVNFINDTAFNEIKKHKNEIENGTWAIYIFTALSLLGFIVFIFQNHNSLDWVNITANILTLIIFLCLAIYSHEKPFTAFVSTLCTIVVLFLIELLLFNSFSFKGIIIKISLIVYLSMKMEMAKKVQDYEKKHPRQKFVFKK